MLKKQTIKTIIKYLTLFIVLMLPLLAMLPTTLYYGVNENAVDGQYQEYSVQYEYETNEVSSEDDLVVGNIYKGTIDLSLLSDTTTLICYSQFFYNINNLGDVYIDTKSNDDDIVNRLFYDYTNQRLIINYQSDGSWVSTINNVPRQEIDFYFVYYSNAYNENLVISASDYLGNASLVEETTTTNASNAFERASTDVFNSSMFSWVEDSPLTSNIVGMISFFGIVEGTLMNNLITYWISVIAIFMIINIVLLIFDRLTHIINKDTE